MPRLVHGQRLKWKEREIPHEHVLEVSLKHIFRNWPSDYSIISLYTGTSSQR